MLYDKGLLKAMKDKYRRVGYSVANDGRGCLWILADSWFVGLRNEIVSNDVKSLIVLHFGRMPEVGAAMNVRKGEEPNAEITDTVLSVPHMLMQCETEDVFRVTPVRIGQCVIF